MAGVTGSKTFGLCLMMLFSMFVLLAAHEDHQVAVEAKDHDGLSKSSPGEHVKHGRMSFSHEDHEGSDSERPTCTCTCYPKPPTSQNSPTGRTRSPPPAPYYSPTVPASPPPGSTRSPVIFTSPPPPAPYSDAPTDEPSPVVAAPETKYPPPPPIY